MLAKGGWCDLDLDPHPFYRQLICAARGVNEKIPWLFTFIQHVEDGHYWAWKPRSTIFTRSRTLFTQDLEKNPPCNAEDNQHAGLIIIEASFGGYWGSPGLGGVRIAELSSLAGLQDYEDTRLKTSSRVRMGLSLAWKASLAIQICRSPTIVTDSVLP